MSVKHKCNISQQKIKTILNIFKYLTSINKKYKNTALNFLSEQGIEYISEAIYNVLYNPDCTSSLSSTQKKKLIKTIKPKSELFKKLSRKKYSISSKRKLITQSGTGLSLLLSTVVPFLTSLLLPKS